ncbi:glycoside hydrolase family 88 protein [Haloarcula litorea]|uniref:glycoside hydrolase family 88 protein n=1 Tax=Haloarcula litorea TaxID=3032579 RepID=UPI0023E78FB3|nr:glycoside hydrolase family 88 protein [Halomicroarcula sp. GDY20]
MTTPSLSDTRLDDAVRALRDRVDATLDATGDAFPYFYDDGWVTTPDGNWCGGHWIGLLWLAGEWTDGDDAARFERAAREHTARMRDGMPEHTMFRGMNAHYAGFRGYDHTGDRSLFALGLDGADAMLADYRGDARQVPLGDLDIKGPEQFRGPESDHGPPGDRIGAVDNVYTALPVLWRAYRETNDPRFRDAAVSHADRHLDWYVRDDGRTWHHAVFDGETGALERQYNELAAGDDTCWARGQGWHVAGLARAYAETGAQRYLDALRLAVSYYRAHTPDDGVPYWDFEAEVTPETPRDTSAAALVAYGLARLPERDATANLRTYGRDVLGSLLSDYLVTDDADPQYGGVLHGCFNAPGGYATDNELVWTDYYVARTVAALRGDV